MHITDEIISDIITCEISEEELQKVNIHTANCDECTNLIAASISTYENINELESPKIKRKILLKARAMVGNLNEEGNRNSFFNSYKLIPALTVIIVFVLLGAGTWYYFNIHKNTVEKFRTENIINELQLKFPTDEEKINKENLVFEWQKIENAAEYHFTLFDEYGNIILEKRTIINHIDITNEHRLISGKKYSWQVDAEMLNTEEINSKLNVFTFIKK